MDFSLTSIDEHQLVRQQKDLGELLPRTEQALGRADTLAGRPTLSMERNSEADRIHVREVYR